MTVRRRISAAFSALALAACAPSSGSTATDSTANAAARDAVTKRMVDYVTILRANRAESIGNYWTKDVKMYENMAEVDRAAFDGIVAQMGKTMKIDSVSLTTTEVFTHDNGTVAYQFGNYMEATSPLGKKPKSTVSRDNFVARWVKEADGVWRISRFVSTPRPLPAAPTTKK